MASNFLRLLMEASLAMSLAILLIAALRKPLRHFLGARAAHWIWLLVPSSVLAVLLPSPTSPALLLNGDFPAVLASLGGISADAISVDNNAETWLAAWAAGCLVAVLVMGKLQHAFVTSMGDLQRDPNGNLRSPSVIGPALVGAWRPRLVLPEDFEARYSDEEQTLVLAHEHAHLRRRDALANAVAASAICLCWFNPLVYWAVARFRFDQELACDAEVLNDFGSPRRRYADAMLKTQLAVDAAWRLPVGCHWQSCHPLKERIAMLKRPVPSSSRRRVGTAFTIAISFMASYAAWAASPSTPPAKQLQSEERRVVGVSMPPPRYPAAAAEQKQSGRVLLEILVAADGSVAEVRVLSSTPAGVFDQAALEAARLWKFNPGTRSARVRVPVDFSPNEMPSS